MNHQGPLRPGRSIAGLVLAASAAAQTWTFPANVSNDPGTSALPEVACSPDGAIHAVWTDQTLRQVRYSRRAPGAAWSFPETIGTYAGGTPFADGECRIAAASDNSIHVLMADDTSGNSEIIHRVRPAGGPWSAPVNISNTPTYRSEFPDLAVDFNLTVHAAWIDAIPTGGVCCAEVYYASQPLGGPWSPPVNVTNNPQNSYPVRLGLSPDNSVHLVWTQEDAGPGRANIRYALLPPGGPWGPLESVTGDPVPTIGRSGGVVAVTPGGTVHAVWYTGGGAPVEIWEARRLSPGSWSPAVNLSNNPGNSVSPDLVAGLDGSLYLVWQDDFGGNYDVFLATRPPGGAWGPPVNLSVSPGVSQDPSLVAALDGSLHAIWADSTFGSVEALHTTTRTVVSLALTGIPRSPTPVSFAVSNAVGEAGNAVVVLLSCTGTAGFPVPDGRRFPLVFDSCTTAGLVLMPYFIGTVDPTGRASTYSFPFPPMQPGLRFHAAAGTFHGVTGRLASITEAITFLTQ